MELSTCQLIIISLCEGEEEIVKNALTVLSKMSACDFFFTSSEKKCVRFWCTVLGVLYWSKDLREEVDGSSQQGNPYWIQRIYTDFLEPRQASVIEYWTLNSEVGMKLIVHACVCVQSI